jgi:hypothetical protein
MQTCRERQDQFTEALLNDRPLMPNGGWTLGDLVFLKALLDVLLEDADDLGLSVKEALARR